MEVAALQPTEAEAAAAHAVEVRIKGLVHRLRTLWVDLAEELHRFSATQMWRDLGYRSFEQWLASPDVDLSRRQVYLLIEAWRELVVVRGVEVEDLGRASISKIQMVLPAIRRGQVDAGDAIADCEVLAREDLRERYVAVGVQGATGPKPEVGAEPFDAEAEPAYAICHACGSRYRKAT